MYVGNVSLIQCNQEMTGTVRDALIKELVYAILLNFKIKNGNVRDEDVCSC